MRYLGLVVQVSALPVLRVGQDLALCGRVAPELVRDDHPWRILQPAQQLAKEALGCMGIAPALNQDVEHVPVLIHGAPKVMHLAADAQEHLVEEPFVARPWPAPLQRVGELPAEAQAPLADGLVADHDPARGENGLDVAQAEAEAVIEPHRVLDHLSREAEAAIRAGPVRHLEQAAMTSPIPPT